MRKRAVSKREAKINTFYKFLLDNDAFFEYRENVRRDNIRTLKTIFDEKINHWISYAFRWLNTKEGFAYWYDLAIKWDEYAKKGISDDEK